MAKTIYALFVGINDYPAPVPKLNGCINDIAAIKNFLDERVGTDGFALKAEVLQNDQATRANIIQKFRDHLCRAEKDDVAFFYYSGHGSQERTPKEFRYLEPDGLDETLVCYDSRLPNNYDLADKELSKLIAEVAKKTPHILVILDSCHSGSGTRVLDEGSAVRRVATDYRERPIDTFIVTPEEAEFLAENSKNLATETRSRWLNLPQGQHILIAACRDDEEAKETYQGGKTRGVFSYTLLETLEQVTPGLTYRDLFKRVNSVVKTRAAKQTPAIEAQDLSDLDRPFLGGSIKDHPPYFTVRYDKSDGWIIDGGAIHGIAPVGGDETTILALFPLEIDVTEIQDLSKKIGLARVTKQMATSSKIKIELDNNLQPDKAQHYRAVVMSIPLPLLEVELSGDKEAMDLIRQALKEAAKNPTQPLLVQEAEGKSWIRVTRVGNSYRIRRLSDDNPLVLDTEGITPASAAATIEKLQHIAHWKRLADLKNNATQLPPNAVRMDIYHEGEDEPIDVANQGSELRYAYTYDDDQEKWKRPRYKIKLTNTVGKTLYCSLLNLSEAYGVTPITLPNNGKLPPKDDLATGELYARDGKWIPFEIPNELQEKGIVETKDILKLIVSTEDLDLSTTRQSDLDVSVALKDTRGFETRAVPDNTLNRLVRRASRSIADEDDEGDVQLADWSTSEATIITIKPLDKIAIPATADSVSLPGSDHIKISGHPKFKAKAALTAMTAAQRSALEIDEDTRLFQPLLPPILRDHPDQVRPFQFTTSRSGETGLSVLELTDVDATSATEVTPEQPLTLEVEMPLNPGEHVLPVAYDYESKLFLPLGRAIRRENAFDIAIERLPEPVVNRRSLFGSIKIFFHKVIAENFGREYEYPILAIAESDGKGGVEYRRDKAEIKQRVAEANKILLFIHGIIGDTRAMAACAYPKPLNLNVPELAKEYDLIMTFDYENINTPIEKTAQQLKERLQEVELGAKFGKTLHLVAHSMGGLVSRYFIEREGGNEFVNHLVMLGTPNGGSPWATVQDWATVALGIALNTISTVAWPVKALGALMDAVESVDVTLDSMHPNSEFLKNLNSTIFAASEPKIPYTILAGNTSLLAEAVEGGDESLIARLLSKLKPQKLLHEATNPVFFFDPNDIAVSVFSIKSVPVGRSSETVIKEVASDHISYFNTEESLIALAQALQ